jgi:hypothetical protein
VSDSGKYSCLGYVRLGYVRLGCLLQYGNNYGHERVIVQAPGANPIKLFIAVTYEFS